MSFWFPTDFGQEWQRKLLNLRAGALCALVLGAVVFAIMTVHPYALLFLLPAIWSLLDMYLRFTGVQPWLIITMIFDFLSTAFLAFYVPVLVFNWMWSKSNAALFVALLFVVALFCHGSIFLRTTLQFLEVSRERSRGALNLA